VATPLYAYTQNDALQPTSQLECQILEKQLPDPNSNMLTSSLGPNTNITQPQTQPPPHTQEASHGQLVAKTKKKKKKN
jgi:hypothetical protein